MTDREVAEAWARFTEARVLLLDGPPFSREPGRDEAYRDARRRWENYTPEPRGPEPCGPR